MTVLITILGRPQKDANNCYRKTRYRFGDNDITEPLTFFGWALQQRIKPETLIILGTAGSAWDHLIEGDIDLGQVELEGREALLTSSERGEVSQQQLNQLAPYLSSGLNSEVRLVIIPYCRNETEQMELLRIIADQVGQGEKVQLDVTHGFRHLPMLALMSSLYLRQVKEADVTRIWYGAYDPDTGNAPVHDLTGLLRLADGIQALNSFDKDGDYGVFVPLLQHSGVAANITEPLGRAAYYENILNVGAATGELRKARKAMDESELPPDISLLLPTILQRLDWVAEERQFEKQRHLAGKALQRRDYLRTVLYAYETVITRICQIRQINVSDFEGRENARKKYEDAVKKVGGEEYDNYKMLKNLRNQVAHGTRGDIQRVQQALLNETVMREVLEKLLSQIGQQQLPDKNTINS
ncbi:MAG: TIGR02221 family CRISPR-associated protein [Gammaproteobacteria bacterium]|nr:TIGR02221 family CRISPR-associated protein [Gammaproteobacteria bacterium]